VEKSSFYGVSVSNPVTCSIKKPPIYRRFSHFRRDAQPTIQTHYDDFPQQKHNEYALVNHIDKTKINLHRRKPPHHNGAGAFLSWLN